MQAREVLHELLIHTSGEMHRAVSASAPGCAAGRMPAILVTDAGFKTPWFQAVEALGWYWVSRVRDRRYVKLGSESDWISVSSLHPQASATPRVLSEVQLARSQAHVYQLVIYKGKAKGRRESTAMISAHAVSTARKPPELLKDLRVRHVRELLRQAGMRAAGSPALREPGRNEDGHLRVHRGLVQPASPALATCHPSTTRGGYVQDAHNRSNPRLASQAVNRPRSGGNST